MSGDGKTKFTIYNPASGDVDPTEYDVKATPGTHTPPYKRSAIPPSHPIVTQSRAKNMGYQQRISFWRLLTASKGYGEIAKFKAQQISELQFSRYQVPYAKDPKNDTQVAEATALQNRLPITENEILGAINAIQKDIALGKTNTQIFENLKDINPNLQGFLAVPMYAQFARDGGNMENAITSFSDVSTYTGQWLDLFNKFQPEEMVEMLKGSLFYNGLELDVQDNGTTTLYKHQQNPTTGADETIALTSTKLDTKNNKIEFSLEANTVEAVIALADQIANHRQGNTNFIELKTMGDDPVLFLVLARTLISQHGMQVGLDTNVRKEVNSALAKINNHALNSEWAEICKDHLKHDYKDTGKSRRHTNKKEEERLADEAKLMDRIMDLVVTIAPPVSLSPKSSSSTGLGDDPTTHPKPH